MTLTQVTKAGLHTIALDHVFTIGASGSDHYTFQGEGLNGTVNDPTLYLTRGKTYRFENGTGAHPIRIQSTSGASGTAYNTGVTNNAGSGTVIVEVQHDAPDVLYYQCTSHAAMNGILYITGALADGGVTTAKLAADAVTAAKLADNAVVTANITDDAVTDAKLANSINTAIAANTAKNTNATHTGDVTGSTSLTIAADAVTGAKIADNAINSEHYTDGSIDTAHIADAQITSAKLGTSAVTTGKINDDAVTSAKIADTTIVAGNIASSAITTSKIADNSVDKDKLAHGLHLFCTGSDKGIILQGNIGEIGDVTGFQAVNDAENANTDFGIRANSIRLATTSAERMRVDSNGQLLVGTTQSSAYGNRQLAVGDVSDSSSFVEIRTSGTGTGHLLFSQSAGANNGNYRGYIGYNQSSDTMSFHTGGGNQRASITDNGLLFGTDTAAANALDDYEEGTWTPTLTNVFAAGTSSGRVCVYRKIGQMVFISFDIYASGSNMDICTSGNTVIGGLPFTTLNNFNSTMNVAIYLNNANGQQLTNYINNTPSIVIHGTARINNVRHLWGFGCYAAT